MAWGHMPDFMVKRELEAGALISLEGRRIRGSVVNIVAARLADGHKGKIAQKLWDTFTVMANAAETLAGADY